MNKQRFEQLRHDLASVFSYFLQKHPETQEVVDEVKAKLVGEYPELVGNYPRPKIKEDRPEDVKEKLFRAKDPSSFTSYDGIENELKDGSPDECLESIRILSRVIGDSRKRSLYYSALQGQKLSRLKEMTTLGKFKEHLLAVNLSHNHACFLIRLHSLVSEYNQLLHCQLPLRFFSSNFKIIRQVCDEDPTSWK